MRRMLNGPWPPGTFTDRGLKEVGEKLAFLEVLSVEDGYVFTWLRGFVSAQRVVNPCNLREQALPH